MMDDKEISALEAKREAKYRQEQADALPIIAEIVGQPIVGVEDRRGEPITWDGSWLSSGDGPVFVLENGLRLRSLGEPMAIDTEEEYLAYKLGK